MKQKRRFFLVAMALTAMACVSPVKAQDLRRAVPVGTDAVTSRGDVNGDGFVDVGDISSIIDIMSGKSIFEILSMTGDEAELHLLGIPVKMVRVEAGTFTMGSTEMDNEKWPHEVTLTSDFFIADTEVTQELWVAVMGVNPVNTYLRGEQHPIINVSWNDCQVFLEKLRNLTSLDFRLPTEAEWEYAARGGNKSKGYKYAGSNDIDEVAWYEVNCFFVGLDSPDYGVHDVKTKQPNELGLYDMSGNAKEWCSDWFSSSYGTGKKVDPKGPDTGAGRVLRGGSWGTNSSFCRISARDVSGPDKIHAGNGLRLVLTAIKK